MGRQKAVKSQQSYGRRPNRNSNRDSHYTSKTKRKDEWTREVTKRKGRTERGKLEANKRKIARGRKRERQQRAMWKEEVAR